MLQKQKSLHSKIRESSFKRVTRLPVASPWRDARRTRQQDEPDVVPARVSCHSTVQRRERDLSLCSVIGKSQRGTVALMVARRNSQRDRGKRNVAWGTCTNADSPGGFIGSKRTGSGTTAFWKPMSSRLGHLVGVNRAVNITLTSTPFAHGLTPLAKPRGMATYDFVQTVGLVSVYLRCAASKCCTRACSLP